MFLNFFSRLSTIQSLIYGCEVWGQNQNSVLVQRLQKLQEKAVCLISFETNTNAVRRLLKDSNILKLTDLLNEF